MYTNATLMTPNTFFVFTKLMNVLYKVNLYKEESLSVDEKDDTYIIMKTVRMKEFVEARESE